MFFNEANLEKGFGNYERGKEGNRSWYLANFKGEVRVINILCTINKFFAAFLWQILMP